MITAEELVRDINPDENKHFKLATVIELFENETAKLQFDGEDVASEKQYSYLDWYIPSAGDRVLLGIMGGTYIILGKVNYNVPPSKEEEIDRYLFDLKKVIMMKGLSVSGETDLGNTIITTATIEELNSESSNLGNASADKMDVTGNFSAGIIFSIGDVSGNTGTFTNGVKVTGNYESDLYSLKLRNRLQHNGTTLGFFGKSAVSKATVSNLSTGADLSTTVAKVNQLLGALRDYGLIG